MNALPQDLAAQIDPNRLKATVASLSAFPNRNTNNPTLTQAAEMLKGELEKLPGLKVELMKYKITKGQRIPEDKEVVQVVAVLPGKTDRRILVGGHFDTINMQGGGIGAASPGADDDASGVAVTLECARLMTQQKWEHTLVFCCFTGEEQGLLGSAALAKRAKEENWKIDAFLNNDMVGYSRNAAGMKEEKFVRLYSEEAPTTAVIRHDSRELARFVEFFTKGKAGNFGAKLVYRRDRFQRGGDHTPFNREGFTAVRFVESIEDFTRQHSEKDVIEAVDFNYLANVAKLNLLSLASLANAPAPPTDVRYETKQAHDTSLRWKGSPEVNYIVYWRETQSAAWQGSKIVGKVGSATIPKVNKDDHYFAVGAVGGVPVEAK